MLWFIGACWSTCCNRRATITKYYKNNSFKREIKKNVRRWPNSRWKLTKRFKKYIRLEQERWTKVIIKAKISID